MKLFSLIASASAFTGPQDFWPAQNAYKGLNCGSVSTLAIQANHTCAIELTKGNAAWLNTGGLFYTKASDNKNQFYVHTYDGHGEANNGEVRVQLFYEITKVYYKAGDRWNGEYPEVWNTECFTEDDRVDFGTAANMINCTDNEGEVEGVYMMGFGTDTVGNGVQNVQIYNSAGHKKNNMYNLQLNDKDGNGVVVEPIEGSFNGTAIAGQDPGQVLLVLAEDYLGQLLQFQFTYPKALKPFEPAQAFTSTIDW